MAKTLVERVKAIEYKSMFDKTINKDAEIRKAFEEYNNNPYIHAVSARETTFLEAFMKQDGDVHMRRRSNLEPDLQACIGSYEQYTTPAMLSSSLVIAGLGVMSLIKEVNRREFLDSLLRAGLPIPIVYVIVNDAVPSVLKQNAQYLDEVYQKVFPTVDTYKESLDLSRRSFFNTLYRRA